jgi:hypothetical protein
LPTEAIYIKAETRRAISGFPDAPQLQVTTSRGSTQLSPQVTAALLSKVRAELTSQQAQIVDTLKRQCPGFAVMRKLVFGFRAILRGGKVTTLHRTIWSASGLGQHMARRINSSWQSTGSSRNKMANGYRSL